ncbi:winged helix-turn-helix domain-containing tetratricopeptide repeat protein [Marimonas lutisalis]|uniref:winged helix-turn-helix domain-containing tetratricopeptide repeat protein n=1 Tax=Marimonas lutisalis TaxID=2545756 RepID=UPI0010F4E8BE|nr:winged helix-turn-helix domain-containing protein [Marimonas lutisalis]
MIYEIGNFRLDKKKGELSDGGAPCEIEPQVFEFILYLVENRGRLVTKDELVDSVWQGRIVSDATLSSRLFSARKAFGDSAKSQRFIKTVPRRGFRFVHDVTVHDNTTSPTPISADDLVKTTGASPSVAVLPFANLSSETDDFFAEGISEDITTELSRFGSIRVISRMSAFRFRDPDPDLPHIGQTLSADYLLTGSVRRAGEQIRISVALSATENRTQVWAERYDRSIADIFSIQDEISEIVASTLAGRVQKIDTERAKAKKTDNLSAYECLLRGLDLHKSGDVSLERAERSVAAFDEAIEKDPGFARAYAWRACSRSRTWGFPAEPDRAKACFYDVLRALELDPGEAEAHRIAGAIYRLLQEFDKADHHIERALELNPNDALVAIKAAEHHSFMGRRQRADALRERAMKLNPFFPEFYWEIAALAQYTNGEYEAAIATMNKVNEPTFAGYAYLAASQMALGRENDAQETVNRLKEDFPNIPLAAYLRQGYRFSFKDDASNRSFVERLAAAGLE